MTDKGFPDVLILGAGPAGMAIASALGKENLKVDLTANYLNKPFIDICLQDYKDGTLPQDVVEDLKSRVIIEVKP